MLAKLAAATNVRDALDSFNPQHPAYKALKAELAAARQRAAAAGPSSVRVPDGPMLRPGMEDARVPILRKRLKLRRRDGLHYDEELVAAVKRFQEQSSLHPDGSSGRTRSQGSTANPRLTRPTPSSPTWSAGAGCRTISAPTYVMVNVPDYTLKVVDHGKTVWSTRIVVGKPGRYATPLLTRDDEVHHGQSDLERAAFDHSQRISAGLAAGSGRARPHRPADRPQRDGSIRIYQPPGEKNALGRIRFNFPNRFLVYQHDTPDKNLFDKSARAYSHGCMRVQNPDQYAEVLLSISQPEEQLHRRAHPRRSMAHGERTINFKKPIPVYITYQTAFVDDAGQLQTRADIYGLDKEIANLLHDDRRIADVPVARNYSSAASR